MTRRRTAGRSTNLALLLLLALSLATGTASYAVGVPSAAAAVTTAHAVAGLGLVLLVPWKAVLVRRGLARPPHPGRSSGTALALLLVVTVLAGLAQEAVGWAPVAGVTPLQVHVAAALLAVPLLVGHAVTHWQRPRAGDLSRRALLRAGLLGGAGLVAAAAVDGAVRVLRLPGAHARATGSTERGSWRPEAMPVTQWFTDGVPGPARREVPLRVVVAGRAAPADADGQDEVDAVLDCTGGWYAAQRWGGVRLDRLLPDPLPAGAQSVDVVSVTGYRRRFPLADAPRLLLATTAGGQPLSAGHGGPRRLVAPGRRGFWWVKWVDRLEVVEDPPWRQPPFPLR